MAYRVPFVDARAHYARLKEDIDRAFIDTISKGDLILRQQLRDFEAHLAEFVGVKYAVGVNSGYHALHLSMLAAGVKPGDEVVTVAHTFVASVSAIVHCGAKPVLVEVAGDQNMDPDAFEAAITEKTTAVMPVHLNGRICDMDRIMEIADRHNLVVIEDAAQALGATFDGQVAGSFGAAGCFSFYPFKILGCTGDGGAVTTNDEALATAVRRLRYNGEDRETGEYHFHGYTALLDNVQAAILDVKLPHLNSWIAHRRHIAELYGEALAGVGDLRLPHYSQERHFDIFQNYVIRTKRREELRAHLRDDGIETLVHWAKAMWKHEALDLDGAGLDETAAICDEVISLPMSAETKDEHVHETAKSIRAFFA